MDKIRLDLYLVNNNMVPSRSKAAELIKNKNVSVNGKINDKPSFEVSNDDLISIKQNEVLKYVSRGGLKLQKAIEYFNLNLNDCVILDIGSSTGGFTDCALKHGAKKVYALDVGTNQLAKELLDNPKVVSIENTNFKDATSSMFEKIDLYVCDVSFISIETILDKLTKLDDNFSIIILYKPQFEVGKNNINKKGVVKNSKILVEYLSRFDKYLTNSNIGIIDATYSPIKGQKEGNIEFLFYLKYKNVSKKINYQKLVEEASNNLKES